MRYEKRGTLIYSFATITATEQVHQLGQRINARRARLFEPATHPDREEAALVRDFFGETPGVFVEVGAYEPIQFSQTWALEQAGWTGLLVEPIPQQAARLRAHRTAVVEEVACSSPEHHDSTMTLNVADVATTLASEFIDPEVLRADTISVHVVTLDSLLAKHGIERIDFLTIDVEGFEVNVLKGLSLERHEPRLILIEDRVRDRTRHDYMLDHGYKLVRRTGLNAWYVPAATVFPVSLFGHLQLFRKYYLSSAIRRAKLRRRKRRAFAAR